VSWLMLAALGMIWVAYLLPTKRVWSPQRSVEHFGRNMELLAETGGRDKGRWIITPQKGVAFLGPRARAEQRARERRRQVFVVLLESIGLTFLIGLVPPLRVAWYLTAVGLCLLAVYVWLLLWMKQQSPASQARERNRAVKIPEAAAPPARSKFVADASSRTPRAAYHGLTVDDDDDFVNIIVRPASQVRVAGI